MAETNGAKAFGGIAAIIAIIGTLGGIMLAITRPLSQQMTSVTETQTKETDRWQHEVDKYDAWIGEHDRRIEARDAAQWERIKSLERAIFGKALPITIEPGDEP